MTGLIYALIIVLWCVVLVPRWLHRHDESRKDNTAALESALTSEPSPSEDPVVAQDEERAGSWGEYLQHKIPSEGLAQAQRLVHGNERSQGARRRRTVVLGLAGSVGVSLLGAVAGLTPGSLVVATTFLLGGYIAAMAYQKRRGAVQPSADLSAGQARGATSQQRTTQRGAAVTDGVRLIEGARGDQWDAREATLPTYVSKPKASKVPRRIDLASGGTGKDMVAQAREQQAAEDQYAEEWAMVEPNEDEEVVRYAEGQYQDQVYNRRAVNE